MALSGNSYVNAYLPACEAYGWEGGPEYSTQVVTLTNGREHRNARWQYPQHRYTTSFFNISTTAARAVRSHFMVMQGKLRCWRYVDQIDSEAVQEDFGTGDGTTKTFQLGKFSSIDGVDYFRPVYALRLDENGDPEPATAYVNDVITPATFDHNRGTITFSTAPADGAILAWTGLFDCWVRFDQDSLPFSLDTVNAHNAQIGLLEMPPPPL